MRKTSRRAQLPSWTTERGRALRRQATPAETALWNALRATLPQAKFRRQQAIGPYHADFCSHAARLVIEVDGSQHAEAQGDDAARTRLIERHGYRVIRFWNNDVLLNIDGVLASIADALSPPHSPQPPHPPRR